jgi:phosphatidylserine synthase
MYLMCGTFRLARFNLQATRPRVLMEGTPKVDKKNFVGLPIPPAADCSRQSSICARCHSART